MVKTGSGSHYRSSIDELEGLDWRRDAALRNSSRSAVTRSASRSVR